MTCRGTWFVAVMLSPRSIQHLADDLPVRCHAEPPKQLASCRRHQQEKALEYRTLGRTGLKVSRLARGVYVVEARTATGRYLQKMLKQ